MRTLKVGAEVNAMASVLLPVDGRAEVMEPRPAEFPSLELVFLHCFVLHKLQLDRSVHLAW